VTSVAVSHDGHCLLASCMDGAARLLDKEGGDLLATYRGAIILPPLGSCFLLPASMDGTVRLLDKEGGDLLATYRGVVVLPPLASYFLDPAAAFLQSWTVRLLDKGGGDLLATYRGTCWFPNPEVVFLHQVLLLRGRPGTLHDQAPEVLAGLTLPVAAAVGNHVSRVVRLQTPLGSLRLCAFVPVCTIADAMRGCLQATSTRPTSWTAA
jgi:hypothetical protein